MWNWLNPFKNALITNSTIARGYQKRPSIAAFLPWRDYCEQYKLFLLEDQLSLGVGFQFTPIPCEARPQEMLQAISQAISEALKNAIPFEKNNPWTLQLFIEKNRDLSAVMTAIENAVLPELRHSPLTQAHLQTLKKHLDYVSRPEGIFFDQQVTQHVFRGGLVTIRGFLYRRGVAGTNAAADSDLLRYQQIDAMLRITRKFTAQLRACGIHVKRLSGEAFYQWLVRWFNPHPPQTQGNTEALVQQLRFPSAQEKPLGWDLAENVFFSAPESFAQGWLFDGIAHKVMTIQHLTSNPAIGHLTAERQRATDDKVFTLLDHLPAGSILSLAIVFQAPSAVERHLKTIESSAVGRHALALKVKQEVDMAFSALAEGNPLLPLTLALYLRGESLATLREHEAQAEVLFNSNGFKTLTEDELFPIDAYLRYLPFCYDYRFDHANAKRARYVALSDIAKLLPFYGRSRGTANPGFIAFNRGGEPWFYDVFKDRSKNAHLLLLGETGTGKSNLLNFMLMQLLALYKPRLFIVEAGGSFDLFADYCQSLGLSVNKVKLDLRQPVSLNPFAQGLKVLEQFAAQDKVTQQRFIEHAADQLVQEQQHAKQENHRATVEEEEENRDLLGEMVIAALVMITGGEEKEEARIRRADRMLVMDAILEAARWVKQHGGTQLLASDIVAAFERLALALDPQRDAQKIHRAREMADSMRYFTQDIVSSQFFNTPGTPWALADVTVVDMGKFAQEGYESQRAIAFIGCVNKVLELAERNQASHRPIYFVADENHLFSKLPLLAAMQTRIAKMGRKLGLWLWLATQNVKDFADEARKMLAMIETWLCSDVLSKNIFFSHKSKRIKKIAKYEDSHNYFSDKTF